MGRPAALGGRRGSRRSAGQRRQRRQHVLVQGCAGAVPPAGDLLGWLVARPSKPEEDVCLWLGRRCGGVLVGSAERRPVRLPLGGRSDAPILQGEALS